MKIRRIESPARHNPRCIAQVKDPTARWRERSGRDNQCEWPARYWVDEQPHCHRHAGEAALAHLISKGNP